VSYSKRLVDEVETLLAGARRLALDAAASDRQLGPDRVVEATSIATRSAQLVRKLYGQGSPYDGAVTRIVEDSHFTVMHSNYCDHLAALAGVLDGVQHDLESGMLEDMQLLMRAEVFTDLLEMAEHLLASGYFHAAAVLIGAVLEDSLRKLAVSNGLEVVGTNGRPLTMGPVNEALGKSGAYNALIQKQVTTWANLRNDAAHGITEQFEAHDVEQMLVFVQKFCGDNLS